MSTCHLCPIPPDRQKARLYAAETEVRHALGSGMPYATLRDVLAAARGVVGSPWWDSRFRHAHITAVRRLPAEDRALWGADMDVCTGVMRIGYRYLQAPFIVAHELAHLAQPHGTADHGPEFAACYLALTRHMCGQAHATALFAAFQRHRVRLAPTPAQEAA